MEFLLSIASLKGVERLVEALNPLHIISLICIILDKRENCHRIDVSNVLVNKTVDFVEV